MSLSKNMLDIIYHITAAMREEFPDVEGKYKVVSLGYPDMLISEQDIAATFGDSFADNLKFREDSDSILRWHRIESQLDKVPDSYHFFELLGCQLEVIDIEAARGDEIILDLNEPMPEKFRERYHLVIEAGTLEHCFNIAQAQKNIAELMVEGGYILQGNPLNWYNHGFYNINPTYYYDFYHSNGFEIIYYDAVYNGSFDSKAFEVPAYDRFRDAPPNTINLLVIRRHAIQPITWPIQNKYRNNPKLQG